MDEVAGTPVADVRPSASRTFYTTAGGPGSGRLVENATISRRGREPGSVPRRSSASGLMFSTLPKNGQSFRRGDTGRNISREGTSAEEFRA